MHLRRLFPLIAIAASVSSGADAPSIAPQATPQRARIAAPSPSAVHHCKSSTDAGCVDPIIAALRAYEQECLDSKRPPSGCYDDLRDQVHAGQKKVRALEAEVTHLRTQAGRPRSREEIEHGNQVFEREFGYLRKNPEAFQLTQELVTARARDPRYSNVRLEMIVRDAASRVSHLIDAANEASAEAAKEQIDAVREDANRRINQAYDQAERFIQQAAAISSSSDRAELDALDTANAASILSHQSPPAAPPVSSPVRCTSRAIGDTVRTDCQ